VERKRLHVLHVEDDFLERAIIARFLSQIEEYEFIIHAVGSEAAATEVFSRQAIDLVILDYYLRPGNGSDCLRTLRRMDRAVPIICMSGNPNRASAMLELGANIFVDKLDLNCRMFVAIVRDSLGSTVPRGSPGRN
jgi:DNA-binding response OmpR family regulator